MAPAIENVCKTPSPGHSSSIQGNLRGLSTASLADVAERRSARLTRRGSDNIMLAEDDAIFRRVLQVWLTDWGYNVTIAEDGNTAWEILQDLTDPQLIILDWVMPGIDGLELCRRIRERQGARYQYILLLTSRDSAQDVVNGLEAGADDYISKPFETGELRARLNVGKRILALQSELVSVQEQLRHEAAHDPLTGSWNRAAILDLFRQETQRAVRSKASTGLLMIDFDHFKKVNDTYGHLIGDAVLLEGVHRIRSVIRSYDLVGRYGGEEFLVVLPDCGNGRIADHAERIRMAVAKTPFLVGSIHIPVTVSIGVAVANPGEGAEHGILKAADAALYRAKRNGRNCAVVS